MRTLISRIHYNVGYYKQYPIEILLFIGFLYTSASLGADTSFWHSAALLFDY